MRRGYSELRRKGDGGSNCKSKKTHWPIEANTRRRLVFLFFLFDCLQVYVEEAVLK